MLRTARIGFFGAVLGTTALGASLQADAQQERVTLRDLGASLGVLPAGPLNAITDVRGVRVGQVTVTEGDSVNTGVTAVLPHAGNIFQEKVPAAIVVGNGYGKLVGITQVQELGELESPVLLTCTLCVPRVADAALTYLLGLDGNENVRSANAVVGETNDGYLNDIRARPVQEAHVLAAITSAAEGSVEQGSVGAGRGTRAFGWKGGIGTSSRVLPEDMGGYTVGVLVQSNYGGVLRVLGAPLGEELRRFYLRQSEDGSRRPGIDDNPDGSIMMVVATDAPLDHRNLERLARRALAGLARTGSSMSNGSGDYVIAFSTVRVAELAQAGPVPNGDVSPLFHAAIEATEEAIYNSLFLATDVEGHRGTTEALPWDLTLQILQNYKVIP
ncbi:MAG: P1 family peptidase [Gemmatimonadota bacterium]|nr:P1 family peptidase [Gemmatimonadota bacterium]